MPAGGEPVIATHAGKDDQAVVSVRWATTDDSDMLSDFQRDMLASVMQIRLTDVVREELGATYSPITASFASDAFPGFGYVSVDIVAEPGKMEAVNAAIGRIAKEMRDAPVSEDLLTRARKPLLEKFDKESRENAFWQGAIAQAQGEPKRLERVRKTRSKFGARLEPMSHVRLLLYRGRELDIVSQAESVETLAPLVGDGLAGDFGKLGKRAGRILRDVPRVFGFLDPGQRVERQAVAHWRIAREEVHAFVPEEPRASGPQRTGQAGADRRVALQR